MTISPEDATTVAGALARRLSADPRRTATLANDDFSAAITAVVAGLDGGVMDELVATVASGTQSTLSTDELHLLIGVAVVAAVSPALAVQLLA